MQNKPAIINVIETRPCLGSGGPRGFSYQLLSALVRADTTTEYALYSLVTNNLELVRVEKPSDVEELVKAGLEHPVRHALTDRVRHACSPNSSIGRAVADVLQYGREGVDKASSGRLRRIVHELADRHPEAIFHAQGIVPAFLLARFWKAPELSRCHLLVTEHSKGGLTRELLEGVGERVRTSRQYRTLERQYELGFEAAETVIFPSAGAWQLFESASPGTAAAVRSKVSVIYNGVPRPKPVRTIPRTKVLRLFTIAPHVPEKGIDRVICALSKVAQMGLRDWTFRIVGAPGPATAALKQQVRSSDLAGHIEFLGQLPHDRTMQELANADLFISFSRVAVFDLALLEAMALGVPVVSSRVQGNMEALGGEHLLYATDEDELARLLARYLRGEQPVERIVQEGSRRYERLFTGDALAAAHLRQYASTLHLSPVPA